MGGRPRSAVAAAAAGMLRNLMSLDAEDQIEALALVVRGWCGLRGHPWSDREIPVAGETEAGR